MCPARQGWRPAAQTPAHWGGSGHTRLGRRGGEAATRRRAGQTAGPRSACSALSCNGTVWYRSHPQTHLSQRGEEGGEHRLPRRIPCAKRVKVVGRAWDESREAIGRPLFTCAAAVWQVGGGRRNLKGVLRSRQWIAPPAHLGHAGQAGPTRSGHLHSTPRTDARDGLTKGRAELQGQGRAPRERRGDFGAWRRAAGGLRLDLSLATFRCRRGVAARGCARGDAVWVLGRGHEVRVCERRLVQGNALYGGGRGAGRLK